MSYYTSVNVFNLSELSHFFTVESLFYNQSSTNLLHCCSANQSVSYYTFFALSKKNPVATLLHSLLYCNNYNHMITFYTPLVYWKHLAIRSLSPFCLLSPTFNNTVIFSPSRSTWPLTLLTAVATLTGPRETINHEWMYTQNLHVQFKCVNECITVHAKFHSDESINCIELWNCCSVYW